jgi:glyoxylase-like metal-dependent hydrolase (beta-lactamase superfamily II)
MSKSITAEQLREKLDSSEEFALIDTRGPGDFEAWHIRNARNVEYSSSAGELRGDWESVASELELDEDDEIVTVCAKGKSSADFADWLEEQGYENVASVSGGMESWGQVYDVVPIDTHGDDVEIVQVQRRARGCLSYVVGDTESGEAAVIDPTRHVEQYSEIANEYGLDVVAVFDTHIHADHLSGGRALADHLGVPYYLGEKAAERGAQYDFEGLAHHDVVSFGDVDIKALHTPGHTTDITSYLVEDEAVLTGDTLFVESIGRTELQFSGEDARGGARTMYDTLHRVLLSLPDSVRVLPGHFSLKPNGEAIDVTMGEPMLSTIGYLREHNRILQLEEEEFVEHMFDTLPEKPANYETVIETNLGKREVEDEAEANELELGPNNCAASEESMVTTDD